MASESKSECCHVRPGEVIKQDELSTAPVKEVNDRLFALIIGINEYQNPDIRSLKGCVRDSENVCSFLTESLHANPLHIKHLRGTEATREVILSAFQTHLIENKEIQPNDAIVFYFAGHGSEEYIRDSWPTGHKMEAICPYDDRAGVRGIPDRTLDSLMRQLASLKGDNITAIFDSCHSGGMGRNSDIENARSIQPPDSPFPQGLDTDIWNKEISDSRLPTKIHDPYLPYPSLKSHVLLAACQHDELAYEGSTGVGNQRAGAFTSTLLDLLRQPERNLGETTYIGLFHALASPAHKSRLSRQTPYVEGDNKTRILFNTKDVGRQYLVSLSVDGTVSAAVGTIHGVDEETEFTITSGNDRFQGLKPSKVLPLSCHFPKIDNRTLRDDSRAEVTKWNQPHLKVFIHPSRNNRSDSDSDPNYLAADVAILSLEGGRMELERRDGFLPRYAERFISVIPRDATGSSENPIPNTPGHTSAIIIAMTHFNFHLLHQNKSTFVGEKLSVKLERLGDTSQRGVNGEIFHGPAKDGHDFFTSGERLPLRPFTAAGINIGPNVTATANITDFHSLFCLTISIRDFSTPLFPYVFAFDASTYEIAYFYHPEPTKVGPLRMNQVVSIGYGNEGGDPFKFQPNEVIFFKVFVTSKYVDMKSLVQKSPFSPNDFHETAGRLPQRFSVIFDGFWESSWIYVVGS